MRKPTAFSTFFLLAMTLPAAGTQKFFPDDPLLKDNDSLPIEKPRERDLSQVVDWAVTTFARRPEGPIPRAANINTLGEVPDSSWFTNRIGRRLLSLDELRRGPDRLTAPDTSRGLAITSAKFEGVTPGFFVKDGQGIRYLIKFDPPGYPQMTTSAEVISTKFLYAFGYHVPENYLVTVRPSDFELGPGAEISGERGKKRPMTDEDLQEVLAEVHWQEEGTAQAIASRLLEGAPLGPFRYYSTRSDDPNDIFRHENRRELRGLRLFSAWLNHDDSRSINSLDTYIGDSPNGYVRHQLIDFGSTLGSGSVKPQSRRAGNEYILEWTPALKAAFTFGIWDRPWRNVEYPDFPSIGRLEADFFEPEKWKPEYPNPAFDRMLPEDAFWAAKIIQRFSDDMIAAIVETGRLNNKQAETYLIETLIKRRDKIVRHYLSLVNPLDRFAVENGLLRFANLGKQAGLTREESYRVRWFVFDNETETTSPLGEAVSSDRPAIGIPAAGDPLLLATIETDDPAQPAWRQPVLVYLRRDSGDWEVVGIERP